MVWYGMMCGMTCNEMQCSKVRSRVVIAVLYCILYDVYWIMCVIVCCGMVWCGMVLCNEVQCSKVRSRVVIAGKCTNPPSQPEWCCGGKIRPIGVGGGGGGGKYICTTNVQRPSKWWTIRRLLCQDRSNRWWEGGDNFDHHLHISLLNQHLLYLQQWSLDLWIKTQQPEKQNSTPVHSKLSMSHRPSDILTMYLGVTLEWHSP